MSILYVISKDNVIHMTEVYTRNYRYYTHCGIVVSKTDRVNTINFDDISDWICRSCLANSEFAGKKTRFEYPHVAMTDVSSRLSETLTWLQRGFTFMSTEFQYTEEVERDTPFMRKMQRYASRKHRKSNIV